MQSHLYLEYLWSVRIKSKHCYCSVFKKVHEVTIDTEPLQTKGENQKEKLPQHIKRFQIFFVFFLIFFLCNTKFLVSLFFFSSNLQQSGVSHLLLCFALTFLLLFMTVANSLLFFFFVYCHTSWHVYWLLENSTMGVVYPCAQIINHWISKLRCGLNPHHWMLLTG